jgi:hypothetical protein
VALSDFPYSFASQPIIDPTTGQPVLNASGGVLLDPRTGASLPMADMNGNSVNQITGNAYGQSMQFRSTKLAVLVKFGSVYVQAPALEMFDLVQTATDAVSLAQNAQSSAQSAASSAAASAAAAAAAGGGGGSGGGGVTDHGALSGLGDDDHPQYHNDSRGDTRYYTKGQADANLSSAVSASSSADRNRANHSGTQQASSISDFTPAVQAVPGFGTGSGGSSAVTSVSYATAIAASTRAQITSSTTAVRVYGGTDASTAPTWLRADLGDYWDAAPSMEVQCLGASVDGTALINAAITAANAVGGTVKLSEGTHLISGPLTTLAANVTLTGQGSGTILRVKTGYTGGNLITLSGKGGTVRDLQIIGGTATTSCLTNPLINAAISLNTTNFATIRNIDFTAFNGWCVEGAATNGLYANQMSNLRGNYNGGGIHLVGASGSSYGVQNMISNVNMQVLQTDSLFEFQDCNDIQVMNVNGCVAGNVVGAYGLWVRGVSSSIIVHNFDVGSYPSVPGVSPIVMVEDTPNNIQLNGGILQGGSSAIQIAGGFNILCRGLQMSRSGGSGALITGGDKVIFDGCTWTRNGYTPPRVVSDAVLNATTTLTSATAAFTATDQYKVVVASGIVNGTYISAVNSATSVTLSAAATVSATGVTANIGAFSEIQMTTAAPVVKIVNNLFETPVGAATQQVQNVLRVSSSTNSVTFTGNDILGGHAPFQAGYLTGGSTVFFGGTPKFVRHNLGYNPVGPLPLPAVPSSGGNTSGSAVDQMWTIQANAAGPVSITVKGGPAASPTVIIDPATLPLVIPAGVALSVLQPAGTVLGMSYTSGQAPTFLSRTGN